MKYTLWAIHITLITAIAVAFAYTHIGKGYAVLVGVAIPLLYVFAFCLADRGKNPPTPPIN